MAARSANNMPLIAYVPNYSAADGAQANPPQIVRYTTTDPNTDGVKPGDPTKAAVAYKEDGTGSVFVWNVTSQLWN